ncbi:hypothetical protein ACRJ4W_01835 [Streptomyces sp. GLT-R25]
MTIGVITAGANRNTLSTFRDLMAELTPRASSRPIAFWTTVIETAISRVCQMACTASASRSISEKLSRPMKEKSGSRPSQSVNA